MATKINYKVAPVPAFDDRSEGLDLAVEAFRVELERLPWLTRAYGRARIMPQTDINKGNPTKINVPKVYVEGGEYMSMMPNDNLTSYSFFLGRSGQFPTVDYAPDTAQPTFRKEMDLIFWGNLKIISQNLIDLGYETIPKDYIFIPELQNDVISIMARRPGFRLVEIFDETPPQVFTGFQIVDTSAEFLYYPWFGFRIRFEMDYQDCILPLEERYPPIVPPVP